MSVVDPGEPIQLALAWVGVEEMPLTYVNAFIGQVNNGEVFLTIGSVVPPPLLGTPEQIREQAVRAGVVPIRPVARMAMSVAKLEELVTMLHQVQAIHAQQSRQMNLGES